MEAPEMSEPSSDDLIRKYVDGAATPAELAELERRLAEPPCAEAFANACRLEAWLRILIKEENQVLQMRARGAAIDAGRRRLSRRGRGVAVAVAILIIGFGLWFLAPPSRQPASATAPKADMVARQTPAQPPSSLGTGQGTEARGDSTPVAAAIAMMGIVTANTVR
jgi:hypothetical protein